MALKPVGIEDNGTFPGRVGTALTLLAQNANSDKLTTTDASNTYATKTELNNVETTPGDSAYEVAVSNGFTGTEAEWLNSLRGDTGVVVSDTAPVNPAPGTVWLDTSARSNISGMPDIYNRWDVSNLTYAEGQKVPFLSSKVGFGSPLTQATTTAQPTMRRNSVNGQPSLQFNKTNSEFLEGPINNLRSPITMISVFKFNSNESAIFSSNDGTLAISLFYGASNMASSAAGANMVTTPGNLNWNIVVQVADGSASRIYWNSRTPVAWTVTDPTTMGFQNTLRMGRNSATMYSNSNIAELVMFSRGLSNAEVDAVFNELSPKYGITVA